MYDIFMLKEFLTGKCAVCGLQNKLGVTTAAKQLNAVDFGVLSCTNKNELSQFDHVLILYQGDLKLDPELTEDDKYLYFPVERLFYTAEYWQYLQTTQPLLDELAKLLPADSKIRIIREKLKCEHNKAKLATVPR